MKLKCYSQEKGDDQNTDSKKKKEAPEPRSNQVREALNSKVTGLTESEIKSTLVRLSSLSEYLIRRIASDYKIYKPRLRRRRRNKD